MPKSFFAAYPEVLLCPITNPVKLLVEELYNKPPWIASDKERCGIKGQLNDTNYNKNSPSPRRREHPGEGEVKQ